MFLSTVWFFLFTTSFLTQGREVQRATIVAIELKTMESGTRTQEVDPASVQAAFDEVCPSVRQTVHENKAEFVIRVKHYPARLSGNPLRDTYSYSMFRKGKRVPVHAGSVKIDNDDSRALKKLMGDACKFVRTNR